MRLVHGLNGKACEFAAQKAGVSTRYVELAKSIFKGRPKLLQKVKNGELTLSQARHAAAKKLPPPEALLLDESTCRLIHGDCIKCLAEIPDSSIDMIFADPPYRLKKKYRDDPTGDALPDEDFLNWCRSWLVECSRVLKASGSIFVMMGSHFAARLEVVIREPAMGLFRRNTLVWWENNPENQQGNFSDATRFIHYFTRSADGFIFNDDVKVPSWRNKNGDARGIEGGKTPDNVFLESRIPGNALDRVPFEEAPPQLPVSIPRLCIRVASKPGHVVLDPFNGNGTTAIAALLEGRQYIGIDQCELYLKQSRQWIAAQLERMKKDGK